METEIGLWNLRDKKIYIKIEDKLRNKFFNEVSQIFGRQYKLAKVLCMNHQYLSDYKRGKRSTPLQFIGKLLNFLPEWKKKEYMCLIEKSIEEIKYGTVGKPIRNPKFPIHFSPILARICGHVIGDGGIRCKKSDYTVHYANKCTGLIAQFKEDITQTFGDVEPLENYIKEKDATQILFPSIVGYTLMIFFGKQVKSYKHIPEIILKSNKKSKIMLLSAVFDDEACINLAAFKVELQMTGYNLVKTIKNLLLELGIRTGKINETEGTEKQRARYKIGITGQKSLESFKSIIKFSDLGKKEKLSLLMNSFKENLVDSIMIKSLIVQTLKETYGMNLYQLTKALNEKSIYKFRYQLSELLKEGAIEFRKECIGKGVSRVYYTVS